MRRKIALALLLVLVPLANPVSASDGYHYVKEKGLNAGSFTGTVNFCRTVVLDQCLDPEPLVNYPFSITAQKVYFRETYTCETDPTIVWEYGFAGSGAKWDGEGTVAHMFTAAWSSPATTASGPAPFVFEFDGITFEGGYSVDLGSFPDEPTGPGEVEQDMYGSYLLVIEGNGKTHNGIATAEFYFQGSDGGSSNHYHSWLELLGPCQS